MQLHTVNTGYFKLDGGAMFGVVPKSMWQKLNPPDDKNLCTWAMRCLLIENGNRLMLVDTGIGNKQSDKFRSHFEPHGSDSLHKSLQKLGFHASEITDVLLTHLHFDHCGGAVELDAKGKPKLTFPNATYWTSAEQWFWALDPNPREQASFLKENILPIEASGQLKFIESTPIDIPGVELHQVFGHTESMTICDVKYKNEIVSYAADLIPSHHHVKLPYVMAYDIRPLETLTEKAIFLERAIENNHVIMFEHDKDVECCNLKRTERGIEFDRTFALSEI
jgi:glyoxylase-like metal-dependent hydrolase (beta-lactamase superfamily II)